MSNHAAADTRRLLAATALRNFAYGLVSVVLGLVWRGRGLPAWQIGLLFTLALLGGGLWSAVMGHYADRIGRRRLLVLLSLSLVAGGIGLWRLHSFFPLAVLAALATFSPSGKDVGPMLPLEQAALSRTVVAGRRTETYARYNILASLAVACGALAAPGAAWLARHLPFAATTADVVFVLYAALGTALFALYLSLHEVDDPAYGRGTAAGATPAQRGLSESRGVVYRLTAMFGFDAMAGGLVVQGLISLWLHTRYGVGVNVLGPLFFVTNLCSALSLLAAAPLARRFGLLNTMVFGHLPSDLFLFLVAFAPSFPVAALLLMLRSSFAQLDVPTRQAYTMELVKPGERSAAAGLTASARGIASSLSPTLAGWASALGFGLPFALAGSMKAVYDLALFAMFRHVPLRVDNDTPPVAQG